MRPILRAASRSDLPAIVALLADDELGTGREDVSEGPPVLVRQRVEASSRGCRILQLTSDRRRTDAHRFYERLGFMATHVGMKRKLDP